MAVLLGILVVDLEYIQCFSKPGVLLLRISQVSQRLIKLFQLVKHIGIDRLNTSTFCIEQNCNVGNCFLGSD